MEPLNSQLIAPIGVIESPFREKFGTPRQPGLVPAAEGRIVLEERYRREEMWRGLTEFSHIWLLWSFHLVPENGTPKTTVRPPRLGGNERMGIFATRSPFRPNRIGLSSVKLTEIDAVNGTIDVSGIDLVNGTPVFDIKPYLPYADAHSDATATWIPDEEPILASFAITYSDQAEAAVSSNSRFREILEQTLLADPRPAYHEDQNRPYGLSLADFNVRFQVDSDAIHVITIETDRTRSS